MLKQKGVSNTIWFLIAIVIMLLLIALSFLLLSKGKISGLDAINKIFEDALSGVK